MTNGRAKGASAEREVAGLLEEWWQKLEPGCRFVRVPMSGGWHGPDVRKEFRASGDVMTTAVHFPFTVEVKRREGWAEKTLLTGRPSPVWEWWLQAQQQATEQGGGTVPMLWLRRSREPWRVMVPERWWTNMQLGLPRSGRHWYGRWPTRRGFRPYMLEAAHILLISPRQVVPALARGMRVSQ